MKVAITGAKGQLGSELCALHGEEKLLALSHEDLDIGDVKKTREILNQFGPELIINCAAYNRVDECERQWEAAFEVNAYGVRNLAQVAKELDSTLVHFSTNYVFDGTKSRPYKEDDPARPISAYGISKFTGELFVQAILKKHFIIRTSGLYGQAGNRSKGGNFVDRLLGLAEEGKKIRMVDDQMLTPTCCADLAEKVKELVPTKRYGLYHITNAGECSWYEFALEVFNIRQIAPNIEPISSAELGALAQRPFYSVLDNAQSKLVGLRATRHWKEALKEYLDIKMQIAKADREGQASVGP